ncbi:MULTISPECIES: hypothetical protein [unclassified Imperialibacter]|uniref:hypothetical protein n=1 Tax=unclassified Imperialibacter TaxID=2629706 RepID=UPI001255F823|nr:MULTISPECIES: hypothetical protein [unclassified Imperialibacter]CAD5249120.1 conserved exported hypothetical protein [Imperialibacter sp. 89]CAD5264060.1 conserved exported hypothetical protein [Imperialibacter sp. 75]VVT07195.1 conserved exported hypothetical protein [Imperialibacter sp. EC-SDR9]
MKNLLEYLVLLLLGCALFACSEVNFSESDLQGSWHMKSYTYFKPGTDKVDKVYVLKDSIEQIKIFNGNEFMWIRKRLKIGTDEFGFGSYNVEENSLIESVSLTSKSRDKWDVEVKNEYFFQIELIGDDYRQCTVDLEGNYIYCEDYQRISY